jgi:dihydrofolate reductase
MARVLLDMAISVDGFVGGPSGADVGLYDWYFNPSEVSRPVIDELVATTGAIVIGRGTYRTGEESGGWEDTPYEVPHFVITHQPPSPLPDGKVRFIFVTDGVGAAINAAKEAAGDRYATIGGGADVAQQALSAGLVDELQLHVVPVLVGEGMRMFDRFDHGWGLSRIRVLDGPNVTHLRYCLDGPRLPS